jgi:hypothetical protein
VNSKSEMPGKRRLELNSVLQASFALNKESLILRTSGNNAEVLDGDWVLCCLIGAFSFCLYQTTQFGNAIMIHKQAQNLHNDCDQR